MRRTREVLFFLAFFQSFEVNLNMLLRNPVLPIIILFLIAIQVTAFAKAATPPVAPIKEEVTLPDLTLKDFSYQVNDDFEHIEISLRVHNNSAVSTGRNLVTLKFLTGFDFRSAIQLGPDFLIQLGAKGNLEFSERFNIANIDGNIYAVVDPANVFEEYDEANNIAELIIEPDLGDGSGPTPIPDSFITTDLIIDTENDEVLLGNVIRVLILVESGFEEVSDLYAVLRVTDANRSLVHKSGELPLFQGKLTDHLQTETYWPTIGLSDGKYTLSVNILSREKGVVDSITRELTLTSLNANHAPVADPDSAEVEMNQTVQIDLAANDHDPDGNRLLYFITDQPTHGQVSELRGLVSYTPDDGFVGLDHFRYQLNDTLGGSDWATVTVKVSPPEQGCTWVRDFSVIENTATVSETGWADYLLPENGNIEYAAWVRSNDNPELFEKQPTISFPSCSLYFKPRSGMVGSATVTYVVLDKETGGNNYVSQVRAFEIEILPKSRRPEIVSTPLTQLEIGKRYNYKPLTESDGEMQMISLQLPDFLSQIDDTIEGVPEAKHIGMHKISLLMTDGVQSAYQSYFLTVTPVLAATGQVGDGRNGSASGTGAGGTGLGLSFLVLLLRNRRRRV